VADLFLLCVGYYALCGVVFVANGLSSIAARTELSRRAAAVIFEPVKALGSITKVGVLLFLRIFLLPMCLGGCMLSSAKYLFDTSLDAWVDFFATNIVGTFNHH
jgi:hypothetical protein